MKKLLLVFTLHLFTALTFAQDKPAYKIFDSNGKEVAYGKMLKSLKQSDIILFGELHNNPIAHWLQLEVTTDLGSSKDLIVGAEMIEADNQDELDQYLKGDIDAEAFDTLARLWPNYETDYAPLVNYAKEEEIPFIATNIPRRFANRVYKYGFESLDSLSAEEKEWVAPLPIPFDSTLPTYVEILEMMGEHGTPELVMAQSTKDATMAHFILKNYEDGHLFIHYNGAFHSNKYEGILWYLKRDREDITYSTITTVSQENVNRLLAENRELADFIICVDENMTTTY